MALCRCSVLYQVTKEVIHSRACSSDEKASEGYSGPRAVGFTIVLGGRVVTMQMTT